MAIERDYGSGIHADLGQLDRFDGTALERISLPEDVVILDSAAEGMLERCCDLKARAESPPSCAARTAAIYNELALTLGQLEQILSHPQREACCRRIEHGDELRDLQPGDPVVFMGFGDSFQSRFQTNTHKEFQKSELELGKVYRIKQFSGTGKDRSIIVHGPSGASAHLASQYFGRIVTRPETELPDFLS